MARRMKGEGSLYQTKDKTWVCQYYDTDGKRRTKRFQRKADGRAFLDNLHQMPPSQMAAYPPGQSAKGAVNPGNTVGTWMNQWLETYARPTVKLSTYCSYEMLIRVHIKPALGEIPLTQLDPVTLQEFFNQKHSSGKTTGDGGLSPKHCGIYATCSIYPLNRPGKTAWFRQIWWKGYGFRRNRSGKCGY